MKWKEENNQLQKTFKFNSFLEAIAFMNALAPKIESINHHPTWENTYNKVKVSLQTHDANNTVTKLDWDLAELMDKAFEELN